MGLRIAKIPNLSDKLKFSFNINEPMATQTVTYNGPKPIMFFNNIMPLMKKPLGSGSSGFWDIFLSYDGTDGSFKRYCQAKRVMDKNTKFWLWVTMNGDQDLKSGEGKVTINYSAWLDIEFEYYNFLQKALVHLYYYIYYNQIIKKHLTWGKRMTDNFKQGLLDLGAIEGPKRE